MREKLKNKIKRIVLIKTPIRANKRGYRVIYSFFCFAQYFVEQKKFYSSFFSFVFWRMQKRKTNQKEKTDAFNINRGCTPTTPLMSCFADKNFAFANIFATSPYMSFLIPPYISFARPQGKWGGV